MKAVDTHGGSIPIRVNVESSYSFHFEFKKELLLVKWSSFGQSNVQTLRQLLERHPFSGRCDSAGKLLHTSYEDFNFHDHLPAVCTTRNTLLSCGKLEQIGLSPAYLDVRLNPSSPVLLTRNGPLRILDTDMQPKLQI